MAVTFYLHPGHYTTAHPFVCAIKWFGWRLLVIAGCFVSDYRRSKPEQLFCTWQCESVYLFLSVTICRRILFKSLSFTTGIHNRTKSLLQAKTERYSSKCYYLFYTLPFVVFGNAFLYNVYIVTKFVLSV